jgi:electron transport complex protein RnfA
LLAFASNSLGCKQHRQSKKPELSWNHQAKQASNRYNSVVIQLRYLDAILAIEHYIFILIGTVFVNNIVLVKILGLCPFMGVSKKLEASVGMAAATAFVLTLGSMTSWAIDHYLLVPNNVQYLRTLSFIVVIAGVVQLTEMVMEKSFPLLYQMLGIFLPLITTNCAVLGIPLLNAQSSHTFLESGLFGFGGALGFSLVLILFASIRERLEAADVPLPFKGSAIAMITAALMSLAFMGFAGLDRY